jgi:hypothetical protein
MTCPFYHSTSFGYFVYRRTKIKEFLFQEAFCDALARGGVRDTAGRQRNQFAGLPDLSDLIYDGHAYQPSHFRFSYFRSIVAPLGIPLLVGKFNSGFTAGATLDKEQLFQYIRRFKNARHLRLAAMEIRL